MFVEGGDVMKFNILGLVLLFVCSFGYVVFRTSGFYFQGGKDVDLWILIAGALLLPYFLSQFSKEKAPYLLLIVFTPVILYTWWHNIGLIEAKSDENDKYLVTERMPALCCDKDTDFQSSYAIYDKVRGPFYKKHTEFVYSSNLLVRMIWSGKLSA